MSAARRGNIRYKKRRESAVFWRLSLFFLMVFVIATAGAYHGGQVTKPIVSEIAQMKARSMLTGMVNDAIHSRFQREASAEQLLTIQVNQEGVIEMVQANTQAMNQLLAGITKELQSRCKDMEPETVQVPLGTLLGSQILSETGPYINLKVMPISVSKTEFETEFITAGINQTKYKAYVVLGCQIKVLAPFTEETIHVEKTVLIAEAVILGRVPDSYIVVPEESVLDATNQ